MKIQQNYSDYILNNPSNTLSGLFDCMSVPGVTCRSLNVKLPDTIDTETQLLRGVQSDLFIPQVPEIPSVYSGVVDNTFNPLKGLPSEHTRMSKSCYFEQSTYDRLQGILPLNYDANRNIDPYWVSPVLIIGSSSRMDSKYSV